MPRMVMARMRMAPTTGVTAGSPPGARERWLWLGRPWPVTDPRRLLERENAFALVLKRRREARIGAGGSGEGPTASKHTPGAFHEEPALGLLEQEEARRVRHAAHLGDLEVGVEAEALAVEAEVEDAVGPQLQEGDLAGVVQV